MKGESFKKRLDIIMTKGTSDESKSHISTSDIEVLIDDSGNNKSKSNYENDVEEYDEEELESIIDLM